MVLEEVCFFVGFIEIKVFGWSFGRICLTIQCYSGKASFVFGVREGGRRSARTTKLPGVAV